MHLSEKYLLSILPPNMSLSLPSTSPSPNSRHVTSKSAIPPFQPHKQLFHKQQKFKLVWRCGGRQLMAWKSGWCSDLSKMPSWANPASPMCSEIFGKNGIEPHLRDSYCPLSLRTALDWDILDYRYHIRLRLRLITSPFILLSRV